MMSRLASWRRCFADQRFLSISDGKKIQNVEVNKWNLVRRLGDPIAIGNARGSGSSATSGLEADGYRWKAARTLRGRGYACRCIGVRIDGLPDRQRVPTGDKKAFGEINGPGRPMVHDPS